MGAHGQDGGAYKGGGACPAPERSDWCREEGGGVRLNVARCSLLVARCLFSGLPRTRAYPPTCPSKPEKRSGKAEGGSGLQVVSIFVSSRIYSGVA